MLQRNNSLLLMGAAAFFLLTGASARVVIEPNPNQEVGMMSSESKYFNCKSDQRSGNERLLWIDPNSREIVNDPNNRVFVAVKRNQVKLEFKNPTKQDSGVYKCVSRDRQTNRETSSSYFKLNVYTPTTISGAGSYRKSERDNVEMECAAISDREAQVEFTWMFGNYDLGGDKNYSITSRTERGPSSDQVRTVSKLEIKSVTKDHGGKYTCSVDTTNRHLSDEKELQIELNVQYKPRFDEMTSQHIWVSEEAVRDSNKNVQVNITCLVQANPVAKIAWSHQNGGAVIPSQRPNQAVTSYIHDLDNMSVLALEFRNADEIIHPKPNSRIRYTCTASNDLGTAKRNFDIKIGRIPEAPQVLNIDYKDGIVLLKLNDSTSEPPINSYRLEVGEHAHVFNRTISKFPRATQEYSIEMPLSRGDHRVNIYSHNPVGWSLTSETSIILNVINGSPQISLFSAFFVMILSVMIARL